MITLLRWVFSPRISWRRYSKNQFYRRCYQGRMNWFTHFAADSHASRIQQNRTQTHPAKSVSKWVPDTNPKRLRRLGKLGEELGELVAVTNRCIIQGINEVDPSSGKQNRQRLHEECADVLCQVYMTLDLFDLWDGVTERVENKRSQMEVWESFFTEEEDA